MKVIIEPDSPAPEIVYCAAIQIFPTTGYITCYGTKMSAETNEPYLFIMRDINSKKENVQYISVTE